MVDSCAEWGWPDTLGNMQGEAQRDKEISLSQFISTLFDGVGQLLPGDFEGLLRPRLLAAGEPFAKRSCRGFLKVYRVLCFNQPESNLKVAELCTASNGQLHIGKRPT